MVDEVQDEVAFQFRHGVEPRQEPRCKAFERETLPEVPTDKTPVVKLYRLGEIAPKTLGQSPSACPRPVGNTPPAAQLLRVEFRRIAGQQDATIHFLQQRQKRRVIVVRHFVVVTVTACPGGQEKRRVAIDDGIRRQPEPGQM